MVRLRAHGLRGFLFRERVVGLRMVKTALAAAVAWELAQGVLDAARDALVDGHLHGQDRGQPAPAPG
ncbi:MAG TPA: hypothetical protein VOB72_07280 [Candidatus Dormibacteraeota bacterium]|nr:hypothetical protein [Candidatus Dormibacteraeota bacterium]